MDKKIDQQLPEESFCESIQMSLKAIALSEEIYCISETKYPISSELSSSTLEKQIKENEKDNADSGINKKLNEDSLIEEIKQDSLSIELSESQGLLEMDDLRSTLKIEDLGCKYTRKRFTIQTTAANQKPIRNQIRKNVGPNVKRIVIQKKDQSQGMV